MRINGDHKIIATMKIPSSDAELRYEIAKRRTRKVLASVLNDVETQIPAGDAVIWDKNNIQRKSLQAFEDEVRKAKNNYRIEKHPESDAVVYTNNRQDPVR